MLLSYLIDLTYNVREKVSKKHDEQNFRRLIEARTALDKTRPLEKKMRYQLDKLLAATTTSFATGNATTEDPLTYRPDPSALEGENVRNLTRRVYIYIVVVLNIISPIPVFII